MVSVVVLGNPVVGSTDLMVTIDMELLAISVHVASEGVSLGCILLDNVLLGSLLLERIELSLLHLSLDFGVILLCMVVLVLVVEHLLGVSQVRLHCVPVVGTADHGAIRNKLAGTVLVVEQASERVAFLLLLDLFLLLALHHFLGLLFFVALHGDVLAIGATDLGSVREEVTRAVLLVEQAIVLVLMGTLLLDLLAVNLVVLDLFLFSGEVLLGNPVVSSADDTALGEELLGAILVVDEAGVRVASLSLSLMISLPGNGLLFLGTLLLHVSDLKFL